MSQIKGYPSKKRDLRLAASDLHVTAEPVKTGQHALSVISYQFATSIGTDTVEASSTTTTLNLTGHSAQTGDIIKFTSGALDGAEARVLGTTTDTVTLAEDLPSDPSTLDIEILRSGTPRITDLGEVSVNSGPLKFQLDGAEQTVIEDTITPANNRPLPVKLLDVTGDINITANDLNVQLGHTGANPDSVQIGDGTEILSINASNEAQVRDDDANTALGNLLTELQAKADLTETQPVSAATLPLPTGAATEATLASLDGKDFATQTTLAALLTELQAKADLTETQPVSAASLPLPSGAATESTLATIDADTSELAASVQTEDAVHTGPDKGIYILGYRKDSAGSPVADGDYHPLLFDSDGNLKTTTAAGGGGDATAANQTTMITHLSEIEIATESLDGKNTAHDLDTGAGTESNIGVSLRLSASGGSVEAGTASDPLRTDPTGTTTQPISASSLPLPTGAATEATLSSIDGKDFATQTTLAALLTELQAKADLTETQPVSAASLPLPTGAATEATLLTIDADTGNIATDTSTIAGAVSGTEMQVDLVDLGGAATAAKQDTIISELQRDVVEIARNDYSSTNVTTGAYVELIASTSAAIEELEIFDSSGETLVIATGAAASEVDKLYVVPGGNGRIPVRIAASTRISIKAVSATASTGEITLNLIG